jgi:hypothetical protein
MVSTLDLTTLPDSWAYVLQAILRPFARSHRLVCRVYFLLEPSTGLNHLFWTPANDMGCQHNGELLDRRW